MNRKNVKKILNHFKKMDPKLFDFNWWVTVKGDLDELDLWRDDDNYLPSAMTLFRDYAEVPCGTVACFAGEVWLEFAKSRAEREMHPTDFFQYFAGEISIYFFDDEYVYGKDGIEEVTTEDIIKFLEYSLEKGHFPEPLQYLAWLQDNS